MLKDKIIDFLEEQPGEAFDVAEILGQLDEKADYKAFFGAVTELEKAGLVAFNEQGRLVAPTAVKDLQGIFRSNSKGYGFVSLPGGDDDEEVYIPKDETSFALEGDEVAVEITKNAHYLKGTKAEGRVIQVVKRAQTEWVGIFHEALAEGHIGRVSLRNKKLPDIIVTNQGMKAEEGELVRLKILKWPSKKHPKTMLGEVVERLGRPEDEGLDVLEILASMGISPNFPLSVEAEVSKIDRQIHPEELENREDFRNEIVFTIDGADAKDLDDAVHVKRLKNGNLELGVHIADVSYYVKKDAAIDQEAYERGSSVYVTDRVVPMLPPALSNGICSLNPREDRLTQSCIMELDSLGQVLSYRIVQSVVCTAERMTYDKVNLILEGDKASRQDHPHLLESLELMAVLHEQLLRMREARGAIDFETVEAKIMVDDRDKASSIEKRQRKTAERMIESFMLLANETVATDFERRGLPFIYRIHEEPKLERLQHFSQLVSSLGFKLPAQLSKESLHTFREEIKGHPAEQVLSNMLLRAMQQARYSEENRGHFGLAAPVYTHFTSPIRRYPDLIVHRLIRELAEPTGQTVQTWEDLLPAIAHQSSQRERRAVEAEREVEKMKKAEYMFDFIGQDFEGMISAVNRYGFFVELDNTVAGLVPIESLEQDAFSYDERRMQLIGRRTGMIFKMGNRLKLRLTAVDKETGEISFSYLPSPLDQAGQIRRQGRSRSIK
ncbi:ribonuclease R [Lactococcus termiticola]|uniref:Ribonuclease R n=1 Tax=Lactococcus termiticola TaxID=2169526 RepID=A0A2R5HFH5_9LACT|nr:ribonuclease R [Lactococcus termiticola]GBG96762.1 exoribonuclease R [Lactococcus termiticola]